MKKLLLVALLSLFIGIKGNSQTLSVDTILAEANIPDTVNYGVNLNHTFPVNISGGAPFTGTIYLVAGVDSSAGINSIDTIGIRSVINKQNDTIMFTINETYDNPNGYRFGGNVVVIWPVASILTTLDTFTTNVFVELGVGINKNKNLYNAISFYPNPSKNYINIDKVDEKITIKRVRIYGVNGQLLYNEKFKSKINISHLPKGLYFLRLEIKGEEELRYKLIKE